MHGNFMCGIFLNSLQNRPMLCSRLVLSNIQGGHRFVNNQKLHEKLNIPPKPKKPLTPYLKFVKQIRPTLTREFPNLKSNELMKIAGKRWNVVDSSLREKLTQEYTDEAHNYRQLLFHYEQNLSNEQRDLIKQAKIFETELRKEKYFRKKSKELGKPKKPVGIFLKYLISKAEEQTKYSSRKEFIKAMAEEWKQVDPAVREKLENEWKLEDEKFEQELKLWKEKMISEGQLDVLHKDKIKLK